jgi:hypothetical protein
VHWLAKMTDKGWFESLQPLETPEGPWLRPQSGANHDAGHPSASAFAGALGKGLAGLWERVRAEPEAWRGAALLAPLHELLAFADRLGLDPKGMTRLGMEYWDFLDKPLARILRSGGEELLAGKCGERLRRAGELLGFAPDTIDRRLAAAVKG